MEEKASGRMEAETGSDASGAFKECQKLLEATLPGWRLVAKSLPARDAVETRRLGSIPGSGRPWRRV